MTTRGVAAGFLAAAICSALLLWYFHDRFWYPTDDGLYAHVAERLLNGEVLNGDIQDIHPGYIHFVHAAAFRVFGIDLVSLRYPLVLAGFLQACFVYILLWRRGAMLAFAGAVAITATGVIQWVSPTANWYCLTLALAIAWLMMRVPVGHRGRLVAVGVLLATLVLFRHLSGVWAAMAVLTQALLERSTEGSGRQLLLSRVLALIMLAALIGYLLFSPETEPGGLLFMALWPAAILGWMLARARVRNGAAAVVVAQLAAGGALPALPLVLYHLRHGSLSRWIHDIVGAAAGETQMHFFGHGWYGLLPIAGLYQALTSFDAVKIANGLYWTILPLLSVVNGVLVLRHLRRRGRVSELPLPMMASFYALVSLYLEGTLYLYYSAGLSLAAVLWFAGARSRATRTICAAAALALSVVAVVFHAGQTHTRRPQQILEGRRPTDTWRLQKSGLDRCSLRIDATDRATYGRFVSFIEGNSGPDESVLAIPNDTELNFLTRRRNPLWFYNSALGIRSRADVDRAIGILQRQPPRLVIFRPADKYNTPLSAEVMDLVKRTFAHVETIDGAEIYRR